MLVIIKFLEDLRLRYDNIEDYTAACPICGREMEEIGCKLVCIDGCGYRLDCSERGIDEWEEDRGNDD